MKFLPTIVAVMAVAAPALALSDFDACADKAPEVVAAIGQFCTQAGNKNVVPNQFSGFGHTAHYKGKKAFVQIVAGNCSPPQWIPKAFCFSQFYHMCRNGDKHGNRSANFGRGGCQAWNIRN